MFDVALNKNEVNKMLTLFGTDGEQIIEEAVDELAEHMDKHTLMLLDQRIYQRPESPYYRRTDSAFRGHTIRLGRGQADVERIVTFSSRLGGAGREYSPYLNRNRRIRKNDTRFFDDGLLSTQNLANRILKAKFLKFFK